jgi:hypothetical protein
MDEILDDLTVENEIEMLMSELDELEESFPLVHAKHARIKGGCFGEMTTVSLSEETSNEDAAVHVLPEFKLLDWAWVQERGDIDNIDPSFASNYVALQLWLRSKKALNSAIATLQVSPPDIYKISSLKDPKLSTFPNPVPKNQDRPP